MRLRMLGLLLSLCVALPSVVIAAGNRPWIGVHGGLSTYSMSDVNQDIGNINALIAPLRMEEINKGAAVGAVLGLELPSGFSIGVGYDHLSASSDVSDASGSLEYDFPAHAFRALGQYSIKGPGVSGIHVGGSLGLVSSAGSVTLTATGSGSSSSDISGSGPLFEGYLGGDWWASPQFAITGSAGYRYAKIGEFKVDGSTAYLATGEKYAMDYSGVFFRAGLRLALTK